MALPAARIARRHAARPAFARRLDAVQLAVGPRRDETAADRAAQRFARSVGGPAEVEVVTGGAEVVPVPPRCDAGARYTSSPRR